jgi:hypothetical protein
VSARIESLLIRRNIGIETYRVRVACPLQFYMIVKIQNFYQIVFDIPGKSNKF